MEKPSLTKFMFLSSSLGIISFFVDPTKLSLEYKIIISLCVFIVGFILYIYFQNKYIEVNFISKEEFDKSILKYKSNSDKLKVVERRNNFLLSENQKLKIFNERLNNCVIFLISDSSNEKIKDAVSETLNRNKSK